MSDEPKACPPVAPVTRHEIMEERGNRDAFRLCVLLLVVIALGLVVLGIAAWNTRFLVMPIPSLPSRGSQLSTPRAESTAPSKKANRSATARGVDQIFTFDALTMRVEKTCGLVPSTLTTARPVGGPVANAARLSRAGAAAGPQQISRPAVSLSNR